MWRYTQVTTRTGHPCECPFMPNTKSPRNQKDKIKQILGNKEQAKYLCLYGMSKTYADSAPIVTMACDMERGVSQQPG